MLEYRQGSLCYRKGIKRLGNPHFIYSQQWCDWDAGWCYACESALLELVP